MALYCEECQYTRFLKSDKKPHEGRRWWRCGRCGHIQLGYRVHERQSPRELYVDIETSPNLTLLYDLKVSSGYVNSEMILKDWIIISWAAQWLNCYGRKKFSGIITAKDAKTWMDVNAKPNIDAKILPPLRALLNEADIVWGHNYNGFDRKKINTRFLLNNIRPPEKYRTIDTLSVARSQFKFASNKLDFINARLGKGLKDEVHLEDWKQCLRGDKKTLDKILKYNIGDVTNGISMVEKLREWITPFPNVMKYVREN